jgi:AsmA protein
MPVHAIHFRSRGSGLSRALKAGVVALLVLAALILLAAALAALGGQWARGPVEHLVQQKTGRELRVDDLDVRLGWPALHAHARGIAFANADWAKQPPNLLTADEADFAIRLLPLLTGRVVVDELRLRNADAALEKDAQGRKNWELPGGPSRVELRRAALEQSRISYDDPAHKTSVRAQFSTDANGVAVTAKGTYGGEPLEARGSGGALLGVSDDSEPYPFKVDAKLGSLHAAANGTVTGLKNLAAVDLRAEADGDSLEQLHALLGGALPDTKPFRSSGHVVHQGTTWRYEQFSLHVGASDADGTLRVDTSGPHPVVSGDVVFGRLDLADLGATIGTHKTGDRALPDSRFNPNRWHSVNADLHLSAREIVRPSGLPIEHFATRLTMRDAVITLDPLEFGIAGGKLSGALKLDGRQDPIRGSAKIKVANVALDRLVPGFDTSQVETGRIDGAVDLSGKGNSVAQLLGNADGSVALLVNGGHVSRLLMEEIGLHLPRIASLKLGGDKRISIRCAAADFKVNDGIMHTETGVFDTTVTRIDAGGDINLRDETLDLTLNPNTKETAVGSLHTPIHVRGTFSKPSVQLEKGPLVAKSAGAVALAIANPLLALVPLMEAGPGRDSDCGRLLTTSPAARDARKSGVKTPPKKK